MFLVLPSRVVPTAIRVRQEGDRRHSANRLSCRVHQQQRRPVEHAGVGQ
jgi:hypothetical protein